MSPAHKPHARVKQPTVRLHFTWTKRSREGLTHHTRENTSFSESPGAIADDTGTLQHRRSKSRHCRVSAGDEGEPGSGLRPLASEPQVYKQAPGAGKGT